MRKQQGYTLIELLQVSAIIGILAAIAIPAYEDYTLRTKVVDGISITGGVRNNISEFYRYTGGFPVNNQAAGLESPDKISSSVTKSVTIEGGVIHILYIDKSPRINNKYLSLRPVIDISEPTVPIYFACGYYQPTNENQIAVGENKTNIDERFLVSSCRSN